jgi:hypothetical protein
LLGNLKLQISSPGVATITGSGLPTMPLSKLEELKKEQLTDEDKDERIARSLAALNQQPSIHLSPEEWKIIVEGSDTEDQ